MVTDKVIALLQRKLSDVDPATASYTPEEYLVALDDARMTLSVRGVPNLDAYTIETDPETPSYGISPEPSETHAQMLVLRAAADLLEARYRNLVNQGAIGIIWQSGLEQESSVQADKAFRAAISKIEVELNGLILIKHTGNFRST